MSFNKDYLSIPPYISTSWENIKSLQMSGTQLLISLSDASLVRVPDLDIEEIEQIFAFHRSYLESKAQVSENKAQTLENKDVFSEISSEILTQKNGLPFKVGFGGSEGLLQHNSALAQAPDMPQEFLAKIKAVVRIISPDVLMAIPKAEPHCNCPHCQIARVIYNHYETDSLQVEEKELLQEEIIADEDLNFNQWNVQQTSDKLLYNVINKLDQAELYSVYLGDPIGCTCGQKGCEHLLAVLRD